MQKLFLSTTRGNSEVDPIPEKDQPQEDVPIQGQGIHQENETHHDKDLILMRGDQVMIVIDGTIVATAIKETIQNHQIAFVTDHEVMIVT